MGETSANATRLGFPGYDTWIRKTGQSRSSTALGIHPIWCFMFWLAYV